MNYYVEKENEELSEAKVELSKESCFWKNQCLVFAHLHRAIEILIINKGSFRVELDGESYTVREGELVLIRSNTVHQIFSIEDGETGYFVYKIKPELLIDFAEKDTGVLYLLKLNYRNGKNIWHKDEVEKSGLLAITQSVISDYFNRPYALELSVKANAILLLTELLRSESCAFPSDDKISVSTLRKIYSAINIVNERFTEGITALDCALAVNMSYTHFSRCFKSIIGKSVTRYLNEVRLSSAEKDLFMSDKSITEIAYGSGFSDVSYFIATYRKIRGTTPFKKRNGSRK